MRVRVVLASAPPHTFHSVDLCSSDGRLLRSFGFDECEGGPHELRAVMRSSLLASMAALVPPQRVRFGVQATRVEQLPNGASTNTTAW